MTSALRRPAPLWRSPAFGVVAALHAAGLVALAMWDIGRPDSAIVQALSVRLIEPEAPKVAEVRPRAEPPKAAPKAPEPPRQLLAAAVDAPAAPAAMAVPPQPIQAPRSEAVAVPAAAPAVTAARFDADYLQNPKPIYPPMSRRLNEEGKVLLRVHVGADGTAREVEIKQSSGFGRLDAAARDAVLRWRFVAARRGADAIESWVAVPIVFSLEQQ